MHTPHAQVHHYQSQAIRPEEEKKATTDKTLTKVDLNWSFHIHPSHIPEVQRWRDVQARREEINQLNRPCFIQWDQPNKNPELISLSLTLFLSPLGHLWGEHFGGVRVQSQFSLKHIFIFGKKSEHLSVVFASIWLIVIAKKEYMSHHTSTLPTLPLLILILLFCESKH